MLEGAGLRLVKKAADADLAVVNSCCVTANASAKSRNGINGILKQNQNCTVVVFGCMAALSNSESGSYGENVVFVRQREEILDFLGEMLGIAGSPDLVLPCDCRLESFKGHCRAFVKVQDGCDAYCTYCIIPKTRPVLSSRPVGQVVSEVRSLVDAGHKEIILTGIFLGAYGKQTARRRRWDSVDNKKFHELLKKVAQVPGLNRIRLSSLEPGDVSESLIDIFCEHANLLPHFHLSLQSGSDSVLKRMGRQYRMAEFYDRVAMLKDRLDKPAISTDLIVGFVGETESEFADTLSAVERVGFCRCHVFAFSRREGTAAVKMGGVLSKVILKDRSQRLRQAGDREALKFRTQFIGNRCKVLIENISDGIAKGHAERYFEVGLPADGIEKNQVVEVELLAEEQGGIIGKKTER